MMNTMAKKANTLLYYLGVCLVFVNICSIIKELVFDNEPNMWFVYGNLGFAVVGGLCIVCSRLVRRYFVLDDDFLSLILAIERVCDEECVAKIKEDAAVLNFLMHYDQEKIFNEVEKKQ